jgi:hypothetical protein
LKIVIKTKEGIKMKKTTVKAKSLAIKHSENIKIKTIPKKMNLKIIQNDDYVNMFIITYNNRVMEIYIAYTDIKNITHYYNKVFKIPFKVTFKESGRIGIDSEVTKHCEDFKFYAKEIFEMINKKVSKNTNGIKILINEFKKCNLNLKTYD